ncbi:hypothetical protein O181_067150 [Austropuccinia psidii MF-1]|uniref:SURP motif domain-containing protein n=1 Tax=Austropuccinia psidii MF-1 TaxID=1389203 RepID=A0A9Q3EYE9_9BASI|nr:hypothetical protein [Austropuccinia psidii MF-1]
MSDTPADIPNISNLKLHDKSDAVTRADKQADLINRFVTIAEKIQPKLLVTGANFNTWSRNMLEAWAAVFIGDKTYFDEPSWDSDYQRNLIALAFIWHSQNFNSISNTTGSPLKETSQNPNRYTNNQIRREVGQRTSQIWKRSKLTKGAILIFFLVKLALETAPYLSGGSRDTGDPSTTNVHVGNLPGTISEQSLGAFCVKWGPIASLKIMWPRSGSDNIGGAGYGMVAIRQNKSGGLNGFVSYTQYSDAEQACRELDGFDWGVHILQTGWGKAMPMPPGYKPQFELPREPRLSSRSPSPKRRRYGRSPTQRRRSRSRSEDSRTFRRPQSRSRSRSYSSDYSRSMSRSKDLHEWPKLPGSEEEETFIRTVAKKVLEHGERFERTLRERERSNPKFNFLVEGDNAAYHFFRMLINRNYWPPSPTPPPFSDQGYASIYSTDSAEESEND